MNRAILAVILTLSLILGSTAPAPAGEDDLGRAVEEAVSFVESHASFVPQWTQANLEDAIPLTDLEGKQIGYAFPIVVAGAGVGRIMVGNSSTFWMFMEAGTANLPARPGVADVEQAVASDLGISAVKPPTFYRTVYLGAPSIFVDIYEVDGVEVGVDWRNGRAIICEHWNKVPLAVYFMRQADRPLGVAWLPFEAASEAAWVEAIVAQWAQSDAPTFPGYADWMDSPEWMVSQEIQILSQIQALEQEKQRLVADIDGQAGELATKLALAKAEANGGRRRLVTAQGTELVQEVAGSLRAVGFDVVEVDELIGEGKPKREDLRLSHSGGACERWDAIVEVRGYARRTGMTADLLRLARFADLYEKETGKAPDKRIYIVNGELEIRPSQRQRPLASATEDLQVFSDSGGVLVWSIDLFRALNATDSADYPDLLESIKGAEGRWVAKT